MAKKPMMDTGNGGSSSSSSEDNEDEGGMALIVTVSKSKSKAKSKPPVKKAKGGMVKGKGIEAGMKTHSKIASPKRFSGLF